MNYTDKRIAEKLKELRHKTCREPATMANSAGRGRTKNTYFSQEEFAQKLNVSKGTYVGYEKGNVGCMTIDTLMWISKMCCVDIGFILGEYDAPTKEITDLCSATGLSSEAVQELIQNKSERKMELDILSDLIHSNFFWGILRMIKDARLSKEYHKVEEYKEPSFERKEINGEESLIVKGSDCPYYLIDEAGRRFSSIVHDIVFEGGKPNE